MSRYFVDMRCPWCGRVHRKLNSFRIADGPTEPGSLADLYEAEPLPTGVVGMLQDLVWCPSGKRWVEQKDRRKVYLIPRQV